MAAMRNLTRRSCQEWCCHRRPFSSVGFIREVGESADCRELLKDIERVVHDDDDAGSAEAHDSVAGSAKFTLKNGRRGVRR